MNVRFEGNNGHDPNVTRCLLLTQSRLSHFGRGMGFDPRVLVGAEDCLLPTW